MGRAVRTTIKFGLAVMALIFLCTFVAAIGGGIRADPTPPINGPVEISYADFIVIMLTAVSVLMTLLAFIVAILAYVGWNSIESKTKKTAEDYLDKGFEDGNELHQMFERYAQKYVWRQASLTDEQFERDAAAESEEE